jgi:uncharacterized membrane protein
MNDEAIHIPTAMSLATEWRNGSFSTHDGTGNIRLVEKQLGYTVYKPTLSQYAYFTNTILDTAAASEGTLIAVSQPGVSYQYAPQIFGILAARVLHLGQTPTLYLAQFCALVFYIILCYFAIKLSPFPYLFTILALFPLPLRSAGSFSYDCFINAVSLLLLAILFKLICTTEEKIDHRWLVLAGVLYAILAPCKLIYLPVSALLFLVPKEKWRKPRYRTLAFCAFVVLGVTAIFLGMGTRLGELATNTGTVVGPWGNEAYSTMSLLANPLEFVRITVSTFVDYFATLLLNAVGAFQYTFLPTTISILFLLCAALCASNTKPLPVKHSKWMLAAVCTCVMGLMYVATISWTTVGSYSYMGMQGRYITPILPVLFLLCSGVFAKQVNEKYLAVAALGLNCYSVLYVFQQIIW